MKTLFICQANVGRSQVAMEFYNQTKPKASGSAGTAVDMPGQKLSDRPGAANVIAIMKDYTIDMSNNVRTQLTQDVAEPYDQLIVMAEPETMPEWLKKDPRTKIWTIRDPKGQDLNTTKMIVDEVKTHVQSLE